MTKEWGSQAFGVMTVHVKIHVSARKIAKPMVLIGLADLSGGDRYPPMIFYLPP
jgi:hypothetical protein